MRAIPWAFLDWAVGTVTDAFCGMNIAEGSKPIMADLAIEQVAPACREKYETGLAALERKEPEAAIAVFLQALEQAPGFVACRQALRRAVSSAPQKRHGMFKRIMRKSRVVRLLGEAGLFLHLRPLKGISFAEQAYTVTLFRNFLATETPYRTQRRCIVHGPLVGGFGSAVT